MLKKWKLVKTKPVFESKWIKIEKRNYKLPTGKIKENYYHLKRPDYVLIIAIDDKERIVVLRQYRRGVDDFVYEIPAGWIDEGETPLQAAIRELREETGLSGEGKTKSTLYAQPAFSSMKAHVVILKIGSGSAQVTNTEQDEHVSFNIIPIAKVRRMIKEGKIKDMGFLSAISVYDNG